MAKIKISGEHIYEGHVELVFDTKGERWLNVTPQKDSTGEYLNIVLQEESIWIKEDTLRIEFL